MITTLVKQVCNNNNWRSVVKKTPLQLGITSSNQFNNNMFFKREDLQNTFSFKLRGAYNKIRKLYKNNRNVKIVTCSAGNHAQGVAYSCDIFNIDSKIVMPTITPSIKIEQVKRYGGEVILHGDNYDEASSKAIELSEKENRELIHPYDDVDIITGAATIGKEIIEELKDIDYVFVPVGGGGLISGVGLYIKLINPNIKIIGVESNKSCSMNVSLKKREITELSMVDTFADGTAVKKVGEITFNICKKFVDEMVTVTNDEICTSIKQLYLDTRNIAEPSGVLSLAGSIKYINKNKIKNKNIINIISGANMDFKRLRYITERSENEVLLNITIPEKTGSFKKLYNSIFPINVTEFRYRYTNNKEASVYISLGNKNNIVDKLSKKYEVINLSEDELAKEHTKYLIGYTGELPCEKIYRFLFPERPGELGQFLNKISYQWNITLFHYRNSGGIEGDVLVGIQVSDNDLNDFNTFLNSINYKYCEEKL